MASSLLLLDGFVDSRLQWLFPPTHWIQQPERLLVHAHGETDYWQRTHYGFQNHNGHFFHLELRGDFLMTVIVTTTSKQRFDQAGLLCLFSESCWLKTSVEHGGPGRPSQLGVVVTNAGYSDWSTMDIPSSVHTLALRVRREGSDYIVEACLPQHHLPSDTPASALPVRAGSGAVDSPADQWTQLRICHLLEDVSVSGVSRDGTENVAVGEQLAGVAELLPLGGVKAGVYACSPKPGSGMTAEFTRLQIRAGRIAGHQ